MVRIVPGIHSAGEALRVRPEAIREFWLKEGDLNSDLDGFLKTASQKKVRVKRVPLKTLDKQVLSHQGVIAFVEDAPSWPTTKRLQEMGEGLILALDHLEDPHNMGSLMRSGWNLGIVGLLTTKDRAAGFAPSAQKVASGAFEHVPVFETANLGSELISLKDMGFWIYGLAAEGARPICEVSLAPKTVFVIGAEDSGLRKSTLGACDEVLSIPQTDSGQSFNASVAGALAGYEFVRQRLLSKKPENSTKKL